MHLSSRTFSSVSKAPRPHAQVLHVRNIEFEERSTLTEEKVRPAPDITCNRFSGHVFARALIKLGVESIFLSL